MTKFSSVSGKGHEDILFWRRDRSVRFVSDTLLSIVNNGNVLFAFNFDLSYLTDIELEKSSIFFHTLEIRCTTYTFQ